MWPDIAAGVMLLAARRFSRQSLFYCGSSRHNVVEINFSNAKAAAKATKR
jgi:hypothetical protein